MYTSNNNIFSKRILLFFFFFFFYLETQQHQTKIVERYSIRSYAHSPKCFTPLEITNASPSLGKSHARGKEARISPLGLKSKINRHRFLAHVANDPATKVSRINEWQRRYKRRGKNPGEQPGLISQAKQDRRARTLMKTNRDDVRGTHAAIYSSTNGLARVSPPLFLPPPGSGVSSLQGRKILSMETRTEENDGELLFCPMGHSYVSILPTHPSSPLLSSKRLGLFPSNKVRPGKKEADADPLTRNGHIPVSVTRFSFLSAARSPSSSIRARPFSGDFSEERTSPNAV